MTQVVPINPSLNQHSTDASNILIGGFIATPVALYGLGPFQAGRHATEAGILTGEAMVDGVVVEQGMKLIFWRERPNQDTPGDTSFSRTQGSILRSPRRTALLPGRCGLCSPGSTLSLVAVVYLFRGGRRERYARSGPAAFSVGRAGGTRSRMAHWPLRCIAIGTSSSRARIRSHSKAVGRI